ncbi:hypothetical protein Hanom_Chr00s018784g01758461 [Helianthus anomalus]
MFVKCLKRRYTHPPKKIGVGAVARRFKCMFRMKDNQISNPNNATTVMALV